MNTTKRKKEIISAVFHFGTGNYWKVSNLYRAGQAITKAEFEAAITEFGLVEIPTEDHQTPGIKQMYGR